MGKYIKNRVCKLSDDEIVDLYSKATPLITIAKMAGVKHGYVIEKKLKSLNVRIKNREEIWQLRQENRITKASFERDLNKYESPINISNNCIKTCWPHFFRNKLRSEFDAVYEHYINTGEILIRGILLNK